MKPLRPGDLTDIPGAACRRAAELRREDSLTDAAELIDSAQSCAKLLAQCCAEKDATIERYQHQVLDQHFEIERLEEIIYKACLLMDPRFANGEGLGMIFDEFDRIKAKREGK